MSANRVSAALFKTANRTDDDALVTRLRKKRYVFLEQCVRRDVLADRTPDAGPVRVLDIGGRASFWDQVYDLDENPLRLEITIANLATDLAEDPRFEFRTWNVLELGEVADNQFDVCFSNSVIEHLGDLRAQQRGLAEMLRVAHFVYLQTPNLFFPIEPHYQVPLVHLLPFPARIRVLGLLQGRSAKEQYDIYLRDPINLLSRADLEFLLDGVEHQVQVERMLGLAKSFMVWARS